MGGVVCHEPCWCEVLSAVVLLRSNHLDAHVSSYLITVGRGRTQHNDFSSNPWRVFEKGYGRKGPPPLDGHGSGCCWKARRFVIPPSICANRSSRELCKYKYAGMSTGAPQWQLYSYAWITSSTLRQQFSNDEPAHMEPIFTYVCSDQSQSRTEGQHMRENGKTPQVAQPGMVSLQALFPRTFFWHTDILQSACLHLHVSQADHDKIPNANLFPALMAGERLHLWKLSMAPVYTE